jgi:hypothetical protein
MSNPSTYWGQLSLANPPQMAIPYVASDNASITINVGNFSFNDQNITATGNCTLNVNNNYDFTGTDAVCAYNQYDSFQLNSAMGAALSSAKTPGYVVSSCRGTAAAPVTSQSGDFLGSFSGWYYSSHGNAANTYTWQPAAGMYVYLNGATAGDLGGELHFATKQNAGALTDWLTLDNSGALKATTDGGAKLGAVGNGFGKINLSYSKAASVGAVTQNTPCGIVKIAATGSSVVVTNSLVSANSIVLATVQSADSTAYIKNVVPAAGSFTITLGAAATADTTIGYLVINTDN